MDEREFLHEILGFDPETGKRLEDDTKPIGQTKQMKPPPEIQKAFNEWVKRRWF